MIVSHAQSDPSKKPICNRLFCLVLSMMAIANANLAHAQEASTELTDEQVIAAALGEPALQAFGAAADRRGEAAAIRATAWSNPRLGFTHEQLFGDSTEETVVLQQVLRLSGRYRLMSDAARALATSERLSADARRLSHARVIRTKFYALLEAQSRLQIFDEWLDVMAQVDDELRRRVEAGESAPYERLRVRKEMADIKAAAARAAAERESRQAHLARLLDLPLENATTLRASGELMPASPPDDSALSAAVLRRPDIAAADARIRAANLLDDVADRWWLPEPQIEAGYKTAEAGGTRGHGFVAGVSLALPFVKQGRAHRQEAEATRLEAEGEKEFTLHYANAQVLGLARRIRALRDAAAAYEREGISTATSVVDTARLAYSAGELGILELIDGYRGLLQSRLTLLEIAADARESEIEMWRELATTRDMVEK